MMKKLKCCNGKCKCKDELILINPYWHKRRSKKIIIKKKRKTKGLTSRQHFLRQRALKQYIRNKNNVGQIKLPWEKYDSIIFNSLPWATPVKDAILNDIYRNNPTDTGVPMQNIGIPNSNKLRGNKKLSVLSSNIDLTDVTRNLFGGSKDFKVHERNDDDKSIFVDGKMVGRLKINDVDF